jgi:hypothetical protein
MTTQHASCRHAYMAQAPTTVAAATSTRREPCTGRDSWLHVREPLVPGRPVRQVRRHVQLRHEDCAAP